MDSTGRALKYPAGGAPFSVRVVTARGATGALDFAGSPDAVPFTATAPAPATFARRSLRIVAWLLVALAVLQLLDMASTLMLLSIGGTEVNPVSAWLLGHGVETFVAAKVGLAIMLLAFVPLLRREKKKEGLRTALWTCASFDAVYVVAVASNLLQFAIFA